MCALHYNEYMRDYRKLADNKRERAATFRGFEAGVSACVRFLRDTVGDRAASGHQAALLLERGVTGAESPEIVARRALIAQISR